MSRYTIGEPGFRRLVRGERLIVPGGIEVELASTIGWVRLVRAILDAIAPPAERPSKDPPQAREFLPNRYTRRPDE